jgi:hypothetical protein
LLPWLLELPQPGQRRPVSSPRNVESPIPGARVPCRSLARRGPNWPVEIEPRIRAAFPSQSLPPRSCLPVPGSSCRPDLCRGLRLGRSLPTGSLRSRRVCTACSLASLGIGSGGQKLPGTRSRRTLRPVKPGSQPGQVASHRGASLPRPSAWRQSTHPLRPAA